MAIPDVTLSIKDGQLGILPEDTSGLSVKLGISSLGDPNTIYSFSDKADLIETLGQGPLVEAAAYHLDVSGQPVLVVPVQPSIAGTIGDVTKEGDGTGSLAASKTNPPRSTITVSGDSDDDYEVVVEITTTGGRNEGAARYSLDGGETFGAPATIPSNGIQTVAGTGGLLIVTFANADYYDGDLYSFSVTASVFSAVTETPAGPNITPSGTPAANYDVVIQITLDGGLGVGEFIYSLDGGELWTAPEQIPGGGVFVAGDTGMTFTFAAGDHNDGDEYSFTATAPVFTDVELDPAGELPLTSDPRDAFEVIVEITREGEDLASGDAAFRYSLDGGDVFSPEISMPSNGVYDIPDTGLTLTFADGEGDPSFAEGDTYTFSTTAPAYSLTELSAALDVLLADPREWGFLHVVGASDATVAAGVATKMAAAEAAFRYSFALLEARDIDVDEDESEDDWMSALIEDFEDFADTRVSVAAGFEELSSVVTGRVHRRSSAWVAAARIAKAPISEDLGRVASGAVPGVSDLWHDEQSKPGLDAQRFTTLRTIIGRQGFYLTSGRMMAPSGSDFGLVQRRRIMDRACQVARQGLLTFLNEKILVDDAGKIQETTARAIERYVSSQLEGALVSEDHASAASVKIDRNNNILSTETLKAKVTVTPPGYARQIEVEIGFVNPALVVE